MLVSKCCNECVVAIDGAFNYFECKKCGKPTDIKSSLILLDDPEPDYESLYEKEKDKWQALT